MVLAPGELLLLYPDSGIGDPCGEVSDLLKEPITVGCPTALAAGGEVPREEEERGTQREISDGAAEHVDGAVHGHRGDLVLGGTDAVRAAFFQRNRHTKTQVEVG
jgi:hypothetical protein